MSQVSRGWLPLLFLVLGACASTGGNPADPWEGFNRQVYAVNDKVDTYAFKPVAEGYQAAVPLPARTQVGNFFGNLEDLWIGFNNLLQGKPRDGLGDFGRVVVNSTIGILGFFDVASEMGIEKHDEDFGQTLGRWGVGTGPFVMLPLLGPSTVRDAGARVVDQQANPLRLEREIPVRNSLTGLRVVHQRSELLGASAALEGAALDRYNYLRDFYLKRRLSQVYDGRPPREDDDY